MANPTISEIKIDNTTYNICDYAIRKNAIIPNYYRINRTASQQTVTANNFLSFTWNTLNSLSDKTYLVYLEYNLNSSFIFVTNFFQNGMTVNNNSNNNISFTPTAIQLWYDLV